MYGDEIGPIQEQAFRDILTSRDLSVYDVSKRIFQELSDSVLRKLATHLTSGWKQVHVTVHDVHMFSVYMYIHSKTCNGKVL